MPKVLVKPAQGEPYTIPAIETITIRDLDAAHLGNHVSVESPILGRCTRRPMWRAGCYSMTARLATA